MAGPPATETQNASSEAERFLDDIKSSLPPPAKRVKLEPVELTISDVSFVPFSFKRFLAELRV